MNKETPGCNSERLKRFLRVWVLILLALFSGSYIFGFMPADAKEVFLSFMRPSDANSRAAPDVSRRNAKAAISETWTAPRIVIAKISVDAPVVLPVSQNNDILNAALLEGVVHYPRSAMPGKTGNVLLFGHSTTLPATKNPFYKVFNRLKELKEGDAIAIHSDARKYVYIVKKIEIKQANDARIDFSSDKKMLTLSTCNIIGGKESRYVVEAEFAGSYLLAK